MAPSLADAETRSLNSAASAASSGRNPPRAPRGNPPRAPRSGNPPHSAAPRSQRGSQQRSSQSSQGIRSWGRASIPRAPPPRAPIGQPHLPRVPSALILRRIAPATDGHELDEGRWSFAVLLGGYAIGLVNVWRFPYVCSSYGGAGFLLPYTVALFFVAAPLLLFEVTVGQWHQDRVGLAEAVFEKLAPRFVSLAEVQWVLVFCVSLYMPVVMGYASVYMTVSAYPPYGGPLPWFQGEAADGSPMTPVTYWEQQVLNQVDSLASPGWWMPAWKPLLGHSYVWFYTTFVLLQGIGGMLKVAQLSILLACTVITIMAVICCTLEGAGAGLSFFIRPDFSALSQDTANLGISVSQALLTLSPAMGPGITFGSCNPQNHPMVKDVILVTVCSFMFSVTSAIVMYAIVGFVAMGNPLIIKELSEQGLRLVFVTVAQGVAEFPFGRVLAFLFFFMLLTLGIDTLAPWMEMVLFPFLEHGARHGHSRKFVVIVGCLLMWLLGLPFTCRGGIFLMEIVDHYVPTYLLLFCAFMEYIMLMMYGIKRVLRHITVLDGTEIPGFFVAQSWFALAIIFSATIGTLYWDINSWKWKMPGSADWFGGYSLTWNLVLGWLPVMAALSYCLVRMALWKPEHMRYQQDGAAEARSLELA